MAKHEFGMMETDPIPGKRYDEYEPQRYHCISVDDEHLEHICERFSGIATFSHTLDIPAKGLMYTGVTLIPPASHQKFLVQIQDEKELQELRQLLKKAMAHKQYIIHYGL